VLLLTLGATLDPWCYLGPLVLLWTLGATLDPWFATRLLYYASKHPSAMSADSPKLVMLTGFIHINFKYISKNSMRILFLLIKRLSGGVIRIRFANSRSCARGA